jgi:hypothetical protein
MINVTKFWMYNSRKLSFDRPISSIMQRSMRLFWAATSPCLNFVRWKCLKEFWNHKPLPESFAYFLWKSYYALFSNSSYFWRTVILPCRYYAKHIDELHVHCLIHFHRGTRGSVFFWDTMLQAGRSRVLFPMRSLDSSIDLILAAAL